MALRNSIIQSKKSQEKGKKNYSHKIRNNTNNIFIYGGYKFKNPV